MRPNILLIITDQQRADTLGAYGCNLGATPSLDQLASEGSIFERCYCSNPLCMPSRASILTGRCPSSSGVRTNGVVAPPGLPLLPRLLSEEGYETAAFGKIHYHPVQGECLGKWPENLEYIDSGGPLGRPYLGFQKTATCTGHGDVAPGLHASCVEAEDPAAYALRGPKGALLAPDELLRGAQKIQTFKTAVPVELYPTTWITDRLVEFLSATSEPFFAWCGIPDPHHPFNPPGEYWHKFRPQDMPPVVEREGELADLPPHFGDFYHGRYRGMDTDGFLLGHSPYLAPRRIRLIQAAYYGMISLIDDSVARIMKTLAETGMRRRTLVLFLTDHGELLGDHGFVLKGPMHYDPLIRVPLICSWPGKIPAGERIAGLASLVDLFPTLLELAGAAVPNGTQGVSLVPELTGQTGDGRDAVVVEDDADALGLRLRTLVTDRWRLTHYADRPYGELFDLQSDPYELNNLWDDGNITVKNELIACLLDTVVSMQSRLPPKVSHA